ncbi:MAG TPA: hypothetical protein VKY82_05170 [Flavobacterium sp.]|nr:hypothetical protein [Flavobacterium sp.]
MKFVFILALFIISISSCAQIRKNHAKNLDTEHRTDVESKHNDDNIILITGKEYMYKVIQKDKNRILYFDLVLKTIPGNYSGGTKIKYKHYYKDEFLTEEERKLYLDTTKYYKWDITSAHENEEEFHIHPPRSYTLKKLEIAPFPEVLFPVKKGDKWSTINNIVAGYDEYNMNRIFREYSIEGVKHTTDSTYVAKIKATSNWGKKKNKEKICIAEFEFNSKLGFTKMNFRYTDGTSIEMTMEQ